MDEKRRRLASPKALQVLEIVRQLDETDSTFVGRELADAMSAPALVELLDRLQTNGAMQTPAFHAVIQEKASRFNEIACPESQWASATREVLAMIFAMLSIPELCACSLTCSRWNQLVFSSLRSLPSSAPFINGVRGRRLPDLVRRCPSLATLKCIYANRDESQRLTASTAVTGVTSAAWCTKTPGGGRGGRGKATAATAATGTAPMCAKDIGATSHTAVRWWHHFVHFATWWGTIKISLSLPNRRGLQRYVLDDSAPHAGILGCELYRGCPLAATFAHKAQDGKTADRAELTAQCNCPRSCPQESRFVVRDGTLGESVRRAEIFDLSGRLGSSSSEPGRTEGNCFACSFSLLFWHSARTVLCSNPMSVSDIGLRCLI
eukprot:TRINITY_DN1794_c0_g1_i1.p1 TRINITY_DN1794_c0_g1~~TRINITY_DN1794_c0_g1_i1.p1  ORF type:complete len:378 (-),score=-35.57 TRINITY_DN1794_c0_g1_i1:361-1494(-)